jgi:hypothetical protein
MDVITQAAHLTTVASRREVYADWQSSGDLGPAQTFAGAYEYPAATRQGRDAQVYGWTDYMNAAAIRELFAA